MLTIEECVARIMAAPNKGNTPYAKTYARAAPGMRGHELHVQILYVLGNLQHWRGDEAREVKAELKRIAAECKGK